MKVLIIGGGGMVGRKLALEIAANGLNGRTPSELILYDMAHPEWTGAGPAELVAGVLQEPGEARRLAARRADVIFLLAAVVSGDAEANFDKGWDINGRATWALIEALRGEHLAARGGYRPRLVFTSSIAVFGAPYPDKIGDEFLTSPQTSYGATKVLGELLVQDHSRKGFMDGISIRLPTICVRPGKANLAASSFFSGIIREPLNGLEAVLPVADTVRHWHASPRSAVGFLIHAAGLDLDRLEGRRALNMPGLSCTVAEQIESLRRAAGNDAVALIKPRPDETVARIVEGWPRDFAPERAAALGFAAESNFDEIVDIYIREDLDPARKP